MLASLMSCSLEALVVIDNDMLVGLAPAQS